MASNLPIAPRIRAVDKPKESLADWLRSQSGKRESNASYVRWPQALKDEVVACADHNAKAGARGVSMTAARKRFDEVYGVAVTRHEIHCFLQSIGRLWSGK